MVVLVPENQLLKRRAHLGHQRKQVQLLSLCAHRAPMKPLNVPRLKLDIYLSTEKVLF